MLINLSVYAHIVHQGQTLLIKRAEKENGRPNFMPFYWEFPGGKLDEMELPAAAIVREVKEETNLDVAVVRLLAEDSNLDLDKQAVFTRLIYQVEILGEPQVRVNPAEHTAFAWVRNIHEMAGELTMPYAKFPK